MFGFTRHEMESTGSAERFPIRVENFKKKKKAFPLIQHGFWWFVHNCITHPLIGICPIKPLFDFHDWTSVKLTAGTPAIITEIEELEDCKKQLEKIKETIHKLNQNSIEEPYMNILAEPYVCHLLDAAIVDIGNDIKRYYVNKNRKSRK